MSEPKIGRLVVASLHQAIAEAIPLQLEFYENWLKPLGLLKEGRVIGAASFSAALSFLRREDPPETYHDITRRAGELAAVWTFDSLGWTRKRWLRVLPLRMRLRAALRLAREIARAAYPGSKIVFRLHRDGGQVEVRGSVFCQVRDRVDRPLCGFYEGVIVQLMELIGVQAEVRLARCRASGGNICQIQLFWESARVSATDAVAERKGVAARGAGAGTPDERPAERTGVLTE